MPSRCVNALHFRKVAELYEAGKAEEAKELLKRLQEEFLNACEEVKSLKGQLDEVAAVLDLGECLEYDGQKYWLVEEYEKKGPYCQVCYDRDGLLVRLQDKGNHLECGSCRNRFMVVRPKPERGVKKFSGIFQEPVVLFGK